MVDKVSLPPLLPLQFDDPKLWALMEWLEQFYNRVGEGPFLLQGYSVNNLPDATKWGSSDGFSSWIYVYDETGGATVAFSDGTNWRRVQDRAIVS